jgi:hemolysin III
MCTGHGPTDNTIKVVQYHGAPQLFFPGNVVISDREQHPVLHLQETTMQQEYTLSEEIANSVTHGIGVALAVTGTIALLIRAAACADPWRIVSFGIFGATMILLYTASTLYHSISSPGAKRILKMMDHVSIFLLIAGTYTPFTLVPLRGAVGWTVFGIIWSMAVIGITLKVFTLGKYRRISTLIYVGMGWTVIVAIVPLVRTVSGWTLGLLIAGGISYTVGTLFYLNKKLPFGHAVWHICVLGGTVSHFGAVMTL